MKFQPWLILPQLLFVGTLFCQSELPCGSDIIFEKNYRENPAFRAKTDAWEKSCRQRAESPTPLRGSGSATYTLPVVVHVIHENGAENISDAQIFTGIQHLNESFANAGYYDAGNGVVTSFQFCLAKQKPDGSPTNGIDRQVSTLTNMTMESEDIALKNVSRWDPLSYVNIWLVKEITSNSSGPGVAGYAYFPGAHGGPEDGIVMEARWFGSGYGPSCVITHEMGHYLGLYHTFQGGCVNNNCLTDGDRVCDTPPDASTASVTCGAVVNSCTTDAQSGFTSDQNDMYINYMDYGNWNCYNAFTTGQNVRMENALLNVRSSLLDSKGCLDPCLKPISANFSMSSNLVTVGSTVNFSDKTADAVQWEWSLDGTTFSTLKNSSYTFHSVGTYHVALRVVGSDKNCISLSRDSLRVFCPIDASFFPSENPVAVGNIVGFTNTTPQDADQWIWTIGGVPFSNFKNSNFQFTSLGDWVITLTAIGVDTGCVSKFSDTLTVFCPVKADFTIGNLGAMVNQNIPINSTSTAANKWTWTVNGSPSATSESWNFTQPNPGIYTVCLVASNGYCEDQLCKPVEILPANACPNPPCLEICDNGLDDDGDQIVDCYDKADCPCDSIPDCIITDLPTNFGSQMSWMSTTDIVDVISTPIIANLDPENGTIPEIIVPQHSASGQSNKLLIFQGDGSDAANPKVLTLPSFFDTYPAGQACIADVDRDGKPELIMSCLNDYIYVYRNFNPANIVPMTLWMTSTDKMTGGNRPGVHRVYAADFDSDGKTELYAGAEVFYFDFANPAVPMLKRAAAGTGPIAELTAIFGGGETSSIAVDLLSRGDCGGDPDCDGLEIAAGFVIYSVDINPYDGDPMQVKIQKNIKSMSGQGFNDGYTTVADLDLNGVQEVIVAGSRGTVRGIYAWNKTGFWSWFPNQDNLNRSTGTPAVANVFDDRKMGFATDFPEIIATNPFRLLCFNLHAAQLNATKPFWWDLTTTDYSGYTTVTTFDFDGDRIFEIVYRDEQNLRIMYGGAAPFPAGVDAERNWSVFPAYSTTADETAVVADVDDDGQANIILTANPFSDGITKPSVGRVMVLESDELNNGPWLDARPIWNQYNYHVVNVNDDLTIPQTQQPGYVELPGPGSGKRPLNAFLFQVPIYDENYNPFLHASNASVKVLEARCAGDSFSVKLKICNTGSKPLTEGMPITFYRDGNPTTEPALKIGTYPANAKPLLKDSCLELTLNLPPSYGKFFVVVNDPGTHPTPLPGDTAFALAECDFFNNLASFEIKNFPKPLDLGPDKKGCATGVYNFNAGAGFNSYRWQDGSTDSTYTAFAPGKYWVEVTDDCGTLRRDTVVVAVDSSLMVDLGPDRFFCEKTSIQFNVLGYAEYRWEPPTGLSCSTCPNPKLTLPTPGKYTYNIMVKTADGCYSLDTVQVVVNDTSYQVLKKTACEGENFVFDGQNVAAGSSKIFKYSGAAGCDSTLLVEVAALPKSQAAELRWICPGETTEVFGQAVSAAGIFSKKFTNYVGCDSTHTVTVSMHPQPQPTAETRRICPGTTTSVFGQPVGTAGVFSKTFPNINGCDSTHSITVQLFPQPQPTSESRQICPGDTSFVFGQAVTTAGVFSKVFQNQNGCDSTHSVTISLLPAPQNTTEKRQICPGETTLVFGQAIGAAGTYNRHFPNVNGCDSIHSIVVELFPQPQPSTETRQICPGETTSVFGQTVGAAGVFSKIFKNQNGCDSTHTVEVELFAEPQPSTETRQICPGTTTSVFGQPVGTAGVFSKTFPNVNGCDSTHSITVQLFPLPQNTSEVRTVCPDESSLIFGQPVNAPGVFSKIFQNQNGCDSTHTVTLKNYPLPQNTAEKRQICPGETTDVFGQNVGAAGVFSKTFPNVNGCDSTHSVTVELFPQPVPTEELRRICPGATTLVFGQAVSEAGVFSKVFQNQNGCDSAHTVEVAMFEQPAPTAELRRICPGTTTSVFGQTVGAAGVFSKIFQNQNGCDSTHTVTVALHPAPQNTSEQRRICAGDSSLIFGQWVKTSGLFERQFSNVNGCDSTHSVTLMLDPLPTPSLKIVNPGCEETHGAATVENAAAGQKFSLDGVNFSSGTQFGGLLPGSYQLATTDANGCASVKIFNVAEPPPLHFRADTTLLCKGDSMKIFEKWVSAAGVFSKAFVNQFGCDSTVTTTVRMVPQAAALPEVTQPTCLDTLGMLSIESATPGAAFSLDGVHFSTEKIMDELAPGDYRLRIRSADGCLREEVFRVFPVKRPSLELPGDTLIELGNSVRIVPQIFSEKIYVFNWEPTIYLNCADCLEPLSTPMENTEYTLVITDVAGCTAEDRMLIKVDEPGIYVPNVFTPNDDQQNDVFTIYTSEVGIERIEYLQVFDRWGNQTFERRDFSPNVESLGWKGDFRGTPMNPAVFVWQAVVQFVNGRRVFLKGDVTLVR